VFSCVYSGIERAEFEIAGSITNALTADATVTTDFDFEDLVRRHQRTVFSIAFHFLQDRAAAEEVAQDVFMELHRKLGTLQSEEHTTRWLRRVACHRSIDYARRLPKASQVDWDSLPEPSQPAATNDPMLSGKLRQLVGTLPGKMRLAVILRYQEEAEPEEIAEALGMPVNTVKSHLHRALVMLRSKLGISREGITS
jgi:RNA polymerase sigma-70 factor, ECF subfamily